MKNKEMCIKIYNKFIGSVKNLLYITFFTLMICCVIGDKTTYAATISLSGDNYKFSEDDEYPISIKGYNGSTDTDHFGIFSISGEFDEMHDVDGYKAFDVKNGNLKLSYIFDQSKFSFVDGGWNIYEDGCDEIDGFELENDINLGAVVILTSLDGNRWSLDKELTNVFYNNGMALNSPVFETKPIQLINGCYYKVIVAYEKRRKAESYGWGFASIDTYDYQRFAEVYKFYAVNNTEYNNSTKPEQTPRKEMGEKIKTIKDEGYSGNKPIDSGDPHLGWSIGTFVINGYTRETENKGNPVFLKNLGDKVTLWFNLKQDIDCINGNKDLTIAEDKDGYDQYFEVNKTNFKRGTLIIRFTDHEGKRTKPIIYTNYLSASTKTGAYTKVELFEEGDYEVALNYSVKDSRSLISSTNDYRIFFKFSIRNGNCMVFPFDSTTGMELSDNAITANGFKLDMARSRYLNIDVQRSTLNKGEAGYNEDVRFNRPAKDGDVYSDEGIYRFTVKNLYTDENVIKTIYVGNHPVYKALANGTYTLAEINEKLNEGGEFDENGNIVMPVLEPEITEVEIENDEKNEGEELNVENDIVTKEIPTNTNTDEIKTQEENGSPIVLIVIILVIILCGGVGAFIYIKKIKK